MRLSLLYLALFFSFLGCLNTDANREFTYVVKPFYRPSRSGEPPPPPVKYYTEFNFILDTSDRLYFFKLKAQNSYEGCGVGGDTDMPPRLGLVPDDLVEVPVDRLETFIEENVFTDNSNMKWVRIGTLQDTVHSKKLKQLLEIFSDSAAHTRFAVRRVTKEEQLVYNGEESNE